MFFILSKKSLKRYCFDKKKIIFFIDLVGLDFRSTNHHINSLS